jgi:hypothetical protein
MARPDEVMVDVGADADLVEGVCARRLLLSGDKAVGELCAIARQERVDVEQVACRYFSGIQTACFILVVVDAQEDLATGLANGGE